MPPDRHRILYLEPVGEIGGAQRLTLALLDGLDRARWEPVVATLAPGSLVEACRDRGVAVDTYPAGRFRDLRRTAGAILWIARILRQKDIGLIHVAGTKTLAYGGPAGRLAGARILWHLFDPPPDPPGWIDRVTRRMPRDQVVSISPLTSEGWAPLLGADPPVVEPGIDLAGFRDRPPRPGRLGPHGSGPHILMVARLQRFKGHRVLIEALPAIRSRFPGLRVHLVGGTLFGLEPLYRDELIHALEAPGLGGAVTLTGHVDATSLAGLMAHCDVLVHPPSREPFGLVLLEAMAWERPVVATRSGGPAIIVDEGVTGRLVPPDSPRELAAAILDLLEDRPKALAMGRAGRRRVEARFRVERMVARFSAIYDTMRVGRRSGGT